MLRIFLNYYSLLSEEDVCGSYSRLLLKYFLAEGVMCGHSLLLASASENPEDIVKVGGIGVCR